jgi:peptide deformylase
MQFPPVETRTTEPPAPSVAMRDLGILQREDPLLQRVASSFSLPADADQAQWVVDALQARAARMREVHNFSKGMGLAAPQLGLSRRVAIVRPPGTAPTIVLLNARVVASSPETDELRYEGCLSFFDVRGRLTRPRTIQVEHQDLDGTRHSTTYSGNLARLVAHEIDHLDGVLYTDRMTPDEQPIPVLEYRRTRHRWRY